MAGCEPSELIVNFPSLKSAAMFPPVPLPAADAAPRPSNAVSTYAPSGQGPAETDALGAATVGVGAGVVVGVVAPDEHPAASSTTAAVMSSRIFGTTPPPLDRCVSVCARREDRVKIAGPA